MRLTEVSPLKGTYAPGEMVRLAIGFGGHGPEAGRLRLTVTHLASTVATIDKQIQIGNGSEPLTVEWLPPPSAPRGYGVLAELFSETGELVGDASTAFDVLPSWTAFPRYGFLSDFYPGRSDVETTVNALARFHLNGLQFYDWHYRHDRLLPPQDDYDDPLGRRLSLATVRQFIDAAHRRGIAAMAYLAIYAASAQFWRDHAAWALRGPEGSPIPFGDDFLGLMDPSPGSPWSRHLLDECRGVLSTLPFDGLHIDQYGDPRRAWNAAGESVDLPAAFAWFVAAVKEENPGAAAVLNAVANWPIEALAGSSEDFVYIEVWPSAPTYGDLSRIVAEARAGSGGKPVVVALYLPPDRPDNILLADALIFSSGGSRIEIGEGERLLADPYFPKHQAFPPGLGATLRRYYDFAVRYGDLIGPAASDWEPTEAQVPVGVWASVRSGPSWVSLALVNMTGLDTLRWDEPHAAPAPLREVPVSLGLPSGVRSVWWATPDRGQPGLAPLAWQTGARSVHVNLPFLDRWAVIGFELEQGG